MQRIVVLVIFALLSCASASAQQLPLPEIGPTLEAAQPTSCNAPCQETAALHGNTLAVSSFTPDAPGGEVTIYTRQNASWSETALIAYPGPCLVPPPPAGEDPLPCWDPAFGQELAINGKYLFVSAEPSSAQQPRAVYVFHLVGSQWRVLQRLDIPPVSGPLQAFRVHAIEASRHRIAIGTSITAPVAGQSRTTGTVHVFERTRQGRYRHEAALTPTDAADTDFATTFALRGDVLVVGAKLAANQAGSAYVYERGQRGWQLRQRLAPTSNAQQMFGSTVAVTGNTIAIGAPYYYDAENLRSGLVYVYQRSRQGWQATQTLHDPIEVADPGENNIRFFGVTLAARGKRLLIGAASGNPRLSEEPLTLLFERYAGEWQPTATFSPREQSVRTQLSHDRAVIVTTEFRWGHLTYLYDLPPRAQ